MSEQSTPLLQTVIDDPARLLLSVEEYALRPLPQAFENLNEVLVPLLRRSDPMSPFDVTVFYSRRRGLSGQQHASLQSHNQHAFDAAKHVAGLILYYQGHLLAEPASELLSPNLHLDFTPDCMSFCIWESLAAARVGAQLPEHRAAAARAGQWYSGFAIRKYQLSLRAVSRNGKKRTEIVLREGSASN
jgi:hypothetical protein